MSDLPRPVRDYISSLPTEAPSERSPAYLLVDKDGRLLQSGGAVEVYGIEGLRTGVGIEEHLDSLVGLIPLEGEPLYLPCVKSDKGISMDVHVFPGDLGDWVLFLEATAAEMSRSEAQQRAHDLSLRGEKQSKMLRQFAGERIRKRVHEFDLISLLRLLCYQGYEPEDIRFASNRSITSQGSLIHDVGFSGPPSHQVTVILNMGLLSAQSPLPSYFMDRADARDIDRRSFVSLMRFFDHILIGNYIRSIYPETDTQLFPNWEMTKRRYLQMMSLRSCSALHWLFSQAFPDLLVRVEKAMLNHPLKTTSVRLGKTLLGSDAVFGKRTRVPVLGRRVTLFSEDEFTEWREPWPREIRTRLENLIFPVLRSIGIDIEIMLVIKAQRTWAKLHKESYLGYDKMRGGEASFRRVRIFTGYIVQ